MDKLIKLVVEQTDLDEALAQKAIQIVLDYLKESAPGPLADNLDSIIAGEMPSDAKGLLGKLGGLIK